MRLFQPSRVVQKAVAVGLLGAALTPAWIPSAALAQGKVLQPGGQVTVSNVQVSAPLHWRAVKPVTVRVRRVPLRELPVPVTYDLKLATPVYAVSASETVLTADAGRFVIRIRTGAYDPAQLVPLHLAEVVANAAPGAGISPETRFWTPMGARVRNGFAEFDMTFLPSDRELFFTVVRLN